MTYSEERGEAVMRERWGIVGNEKGGLPCPATILDLGAAEGYFSVKWAETYGDTVVACDPSLGLLEAAQAHPDLPLIVCRAGLTEGLLWELGRCEYFDLTLCLNILHHFGAGWAQALAAVLTLGDRVLFETPDSYDTGACQAQYVPEIYHALVDRLPTTRLALVPSHTSRYPRWIGVLDTPKFTLQQSYWGAPEGAKRPGSVYLYQSGSQEWGVWPRKGEKREWLPGINLATYLALDGRWPKRSELAACARETVAGLQDNHGDIGPWNWIVTGDRVNPVQLIDYHDFTRDDQEGLQMTLDAIGDD